MKKSPQRPSAPRLSSARRVAGFTLIEVLISLIVLVLGVLGAAAMTLTSLRDSKQSGLRSQASALAYELGDLMRANGPLQESVFEGGPGAATSSCWVGGCAPSAMAGNDLYEWRLKAFGNGGTVLGILPNGAAKICRDVSALSASQSAYNATCDGLTTSPVVVKMSWTEKNDNARDAASRTGANAPTAATTVYFNVPLQPYN